MSSRQPQPKASGYTLKQVLAAGQATRVGRPPEPGSRRAQEQAHDRGAPRYAGRDANPEGVLDQQDIITLVAEQLVKNGVDEPSTLCTVLPKWCALQRIPCDDRVYQMACQAFGFVGPDAQEMADFWWTRHLTDLITANERAGNFDGQAGPWEKTYRKVCLVVTWGGQGSIINRAFVKRWVLALNDIRGGADRTKVLVELWEFVAHGYVPLSSSLSSSVDRRYLEAQSEMLLAMRKVFEHLVKSLLGPQRAAIVARGKVEGPRVTVPAGAYQQAQKDMKALLRVNFIAQEQGLPSAMNALLDASPANANMRVSLSDQQGPEKVRWGSLDIAAFLLPPSKGADTFAGTFEPGADAIVFIANPAIDAVLSRPEYDPRKCVDEPDGRTLLSLYLKMIHVGAYTSDNTYFNKRYTLLRILNHPLTDFRQTQWGDGLVHQCLKLSIEIKNAPWLTLQQRIAREINAWQFRKSALILLREATRMVSVGSRDPWRWSDKQGRTARALWDEKWAAWKARVMPLGPSSTNIELMDRVESAINDVFIVA